jgi:hypothetical protein
MANQLQIKIGLDDRELNDKIKQLPDKFKSALDPAAGHVNSLRSAVGGLTSALVGLGAIAAFKQIAQFGVDLDKSRNAMTALTGSTEKANAKLAELRELAKTSPGVTNTFATQLFQQLKAVGGIADQTINTVIKSLGKLNTVFSDVGPEFARNLVQIFQQGFERSDIKEALGRVPIFEQLLKSAFGTDDPAKLKKLKDTGKLTLSQFLDGFSQAINNDPRFKNIQESLGSKLQKSFDETKLKLAELGEKPLQSLIPALEKLLPILSKILDFLNLLPDGLKAATIGMLAVAPAINTVAGAIGSLRIAVMALGGFLASPAGIAVLGLIGAGVAIQGFSDMLAREQANIDRQLGPKRNIDGSKVNPFGTNEFFGLIDPNALNKNLKVGGGRLTFNPDTGTFIQSAAAARTNAAASGTRTRRTGIDLPTLTSDDLISSDAALQAVINERESAIFAGRARRTELTAAFEATERKDQLAQGRLTRKALTQDFEEQQKALKSLQPVLSNSERLMLGFASAVETTGDAFERFGANIASSFRNVGSLLSNLKNAILGFFNDLLGQSLQRVFGQLLAPIAGLFGGGGGNLFRTPSFAGSIQSFFGGGLSAPASVTQGRQFTQLISDVAGPATRPRTVAGAAQSAADGFSLGGILGGLASAAPLLGAGIGAGFGGQSTFGNILGAVGGGAVGLGLSFGASVFSAAGGGLGALGPAALAALGPIALIGAPLLVGAIFAGKAAQRRKDEEASGQFLTQAVQAVEQLAAAVRGGQVDVSQARQIFDSQILATFRQQINTLKTKSVRDSRLKNQVNDLEKMYRDLVEPAITAQVQQRRDSARFSAIDSRLIPQFAGGGFVPGVDHGFDSVKALVRPGEVILNRQQQQAVIGQSNPNVFQNAGVPFMNTSGRFEGGGVASGEGGEPMIIELDVRLGLSENDAQRILNAGAKSRSGRKIIVRAVQQD